MLTSKAASGGAMQRGQAGSEVTADFRDPYKETSINRRPQRNAVKILAK
jgi:hypothetical protein